MRFAVVALLLALVVAVPALADEPEPYVRDCEMSVFGDLGQGWQERAIVAGHVSFVGLKSGYQRWRPGGPGGWPVKVLVVVDPNAAPTVTIAARSRGHASLGYNDIRHNGRGVPIDRGTQSVRFEACRPNTAREPWNRGTQFAGYFLVSGRRCVHIEVATQGRIIRRALRFGVPRCARLTTPDA
jgi:hypothetical protein